jgi:hypothetical protein
LALLRDFDASGEMAWGAAVLAHLYRELGKASMKGKANCCAFLTLLQVVYFSSHAVLSLSAAINVNSVHTADMGMGAYPDRPS